MYSGYAAYKQVHVKTASQGNLLLMLFDGAITHGRIAVEALKEGSKEEAHRRLIKVQDIVTELMNSLNMQLDISHNLYALYAYCSERLVAANVAKDPEPANEALELLMELRETWQAVVEGDPAAAEEGLAEGDAEESGAGGPSAARAEIKTDAATKGTAEGRPAALKTDPKTPRDPVGVSGRIEITG